MEKRKRIGSQRTLRKTALVIEGNNILGRNIINCLEAKGNWDIIIVSNTPLNYWQYTSRCEYIQMDLNKPDAIKMQQEKLQKVTHVFFGSYNQKQALTDKPEFNLQLFENLVLGIEKIAPLFEHITFIQKDKAYDLHFGRIKQIVSNKEYQYFSPSFFYNFYSLQEDFLRKQSIGKKWSWTSLRPNILIGSAIDNPTNIATQIAVYATLCRELNIPMSFPGNIRNYETTVHVTDIELLAKSMEYVSLEDSCKGEIFNITNGDSLRWKELWVKICEYFGVAVGEPHDFSLAVYMKDKNTLWKETCEKHQLTNDNITRILQWSYSDFIFSDVYDIFFDSGKLRKLGFKEIEPDSFESFKRMFDKLKANHIIPHYLLNEYIVSYSKNHQERVIQIT
ncbi:MULTISPECIES: hypothetical protein [unclassified Dysgonomonas]|uniref:hypothetical protein n=1 Tax=unclassified Dysgonomonas TaxID=2630389 RepID=UPI0013EE2CFA|nr:MULTISPECIES: hypothetical protein [unclassified Dysgonomonas]